MARPTKNKTKLTNKQRFAALWRVGKIAYKAAPSIFYLQIVRAVIDSALPILTTFFAAQTTTELARAYNGEAGAGDAAIMYVLLTAGLGVITLAWSTIESQITRSAQYKLTSTVNDQLEHQFLSLDYWRYDDKETADLLDKSRQFSGFFSYMFSTISSMLTALVTLIFSIVALALVNGWLALLLIVAVLPGMVIQYKISKARTDHWAENVTVRRKASDIQWQITRIDTIAEVRLYGLARFLLNLRQKYRDQDEKEQIKIERRFVKYELLSSITEAIAEVVALIYVTLQIIAHALPIGQFVFVQQIVSRGLSSMRGFASGLINIDEDLANLGAYDQFMKLPNQVKGSRQLMAPPETITVQNASFHYPNNLDKAVLSNVSLHVNQNAHVAIVGENGAGKSTLIKLLLGFYLPTKGEVLIDDISTANLDLDSWHDKVAVLQQFSSEYMFADARDNVLYGDVSRPVSDARYKQAVKNAEAKEFLDDLPKKDHTYITQWMESEDGTPGVSLSGGQSQRLALARNFYRNSPVVILDEPTSAIDALAESRIFERLFEEKDKTIVTISHRLSTVRRADWIYVLEDGKIVEEGTHDELVTKKGHYYKLFESQLKP